MDYETFVDTTTGIFNVAWLAGTTAIVGYVPKIYWQGVEPDQKLENDKFAVIVSQVGNDDQQQAFGDRQKLYEIIGLVSITIFCPQSDTKSMEKGRKLAILVRDVYRGITEDGIHFTNTKIQEIEPVRKFNTFMVLTNYRYVERV